MQDIQQQQQKKKHHHPSSLLLPSLHPFSEPEQKSWRMRTQPLKYRNPNVAVTPPDESDTVKKQKTKQTNLWLEEGTPVIVQLRLQRGKKAQLVDRILTQ